MCLIRKLLVLDPQQRLTASEVLDSLSSIIASWYVAEDVVLELCYSSCGQQAAAKHRAPEDALWEQQKSIKSCVVRLWGLQVGVASTVSAHAVTQTALCGVTEHCWVQEGFCCCAPQLTPDLTLKCERSGISHVYMQPNLDSSCKLMRGSALPLSVSKQISKKRRAGDTAAEEHTTLQGERPFKDKSSARTGTDQQPERFQELWQKLIPTVCDLCSPLPSPCDLLSAPSSAPRPSSCSAC